MILALNIRYLVKLVMDDFSILETWAVPLGSLKGAKGAYFQNKSEFFNTCIGMLICKQVMVHEIE